MDRLPTDVLNDILDQLNPVGHEIPPNPHRSNPWAKPQPYKPDNIDSKHFYAQFRLVCKRFSVLGGPYLFRSISLRFNRTSFRRLQLLAKNKELSRHVRSLVYLMPYLYEKGALSFDEFRNDESMGLSKKIRQIMFEDQEPYYYLSVWDEQQQIINESYDVRVLTEAMRAFVSLQQVQLLAIMVHKDVVLRNLASSFDQWHFMDCRWVPACKHATETLLRALWSAQSPATAFCSPTLSPHSLLLLSPSARDNAMAVFGRLTYLDISFDERPDRSYLDTSGTVFTGHNGSLSSFFRDLFACAENLTTLYIRFTGMPVRLPLADVLHSFSWPKLRVLGLGGWMLRADELIDLARRHKDSLRGLRLCEIYLLDGERWRDVVLAWKHLLGRLEWVELQDISYEGDHVRKQAYIETYSDTSSDTDLDEYFDTMSMGSLESNGSSSPSNVSSAHEGEDVIYGTVFTSSPVGSQGTGPAGGGTWTNGGEGMQHGLLQGDQDTATDSDSGDLADTLEDDGRTVCQAQRRHWECWILGRNFRSGELYRKAL